MQRFARILQTWHFRKVIGFRDIPVLLSSMANAVAKSPVGKVAAVA
jgi:hypothetical protein